MAVMMKKKQGAAARDLYVTSFLVDRSLIAALRAIAREKETSLSAVVRVALKLYVRRIQAEAAAEAGEAAA